MKLRFKKGIIKIERDVARARRQTMNICLNSENIYFHAHLSNEQTRVFVYFHFSSNYNPR